MSAIRGDLAPPRLAETLLACLLPPGMRESVLGDLAEEHAVRAAAGERARRWYWAQVLRSTPTLLRHRARAARRARATQRSGDGLMHTLAQDLRYAARQFAKSPAFTLVVVLTLGLGIGANTLIFSLVDGVVLNPFPYPEPDRLVGVGPIYPKLGRDLAFWEVLSPPEYLDIQEQSRTLERVVSWDMGHRAVTFGDRTENLFSAFWWGDAFPTLDVRPTLGRGFLPEEIEGGERVAILSHRIWSGALGGDSSVVGSSILVNGNPHTVIGIMPPRTSIYGTDLWLPMGADPSVFPRNRRQMQVLARLAPGATLEEANAELDLIAGRIEGEHGAELAEYEGWSLTALPWTEVNVRMVKPAAVVLLGAVGFVLLLVCANVASLLLARATGRRAEVALRTALGAARGRILRQLLTESVALALAGAVLGVGLAWIGVQALVSALGALQLPIPGEVAVNGRVLAFTAAVSLGAGLIFGLVPALHALRGDLRGALSADAGGTAGRGRLRLQRALVGAEVALALVLLVGGGLLLHSFARLRAAEPGVRTEDVLTMRLTLPWERYQTADIQRFFRELQERTEALPGVRRTAVASQLPPLLFMRRQFQIEGADAVGEGELPTAYATVVSPGYFDALGIRLLRGRLLGDTEVPGGPVAALANEAAVERYFPGQDPLGRRIRLGADAEGPWIEIVGVVSDARNAGVERPPEPELFASAWQIPSGNQLFLLLRTEGEPYALLPAVRGVVRDMDPNQPVYAIRSLEEAFSAAAVTQRISTVTMALLAAFALLLAGVGIYGVVSYATAQRTREIGIRMALGARAGEVRRLMVRQALVPVVVGGLVGMAGALAVGRLLSGLLFQVSATDPLTLSAVLALLVGTALLASWVPARRASGVDPVRALRQDEQRR